MQHLEQLAYELREARGRKGLTEEAAAEQSGVFYYTLVTLEAGKLSLPPPHMLLQLAQLYDLDYLHLLQLAGHLRKKPSE